jgi:hypothetical protein
MKNPSSCAFSSGALRIDLLQLRNCMNRSHPMKEDILNPDDIDYTDCLPEDLQPKVSVNQKNVSHPMSLS